MDLYLTSAKKVFANYKQLAEKALAQIPDEVLHWQQNPDSNSVVTIMKHMWGNMRSRWTDFLTTDGEKPWRERDAEFENEGLDRAALMLLWEEGWKYVFNALDALSQDDLGKTVTIRQEPQTALDAINRQIAHYAYHVGQIVYIAKLHATEWNTLTIPRKK